MSQKPKLIFEDNARNFSINSCSIRSGVMQQSGGNAIKSNQEDESKKSKNNALNDILFIQKNPKYLIKHTD